jgi:hypothetical protein
MKLSKQDIQDLLHCINRQFEIQTNEEFYDRLANLEARLEAETAK